MTTFTRDDYGARRRPSPTPGSSTAPRSPACPSRSRAGKAGLDTAEWFKDLPGGACQEPHWGYLASRAR